MESSRRSPHFNTIAAGKANGSLYFPLLFDDDLVMLSVLKIAPKSLGDESQLILRPVKGKQKPYVTKGGLLPVKNEQKTAGFEENRA